MVRVPLYGDLLPRDTLQVLDDADTDVLRLEDRPLLDMQLQIRMRDDRTRFEVAA